MPVWLFFHKYSRFTGEQVKREAISLYPFYHFYPLHRHLDNNWVIAAKSSPLRIVATRNGTWKPMGYTLFTIHSFYTCMVATVIRRTLKTRVTLGNISRILLNLTPILLNLINICNVQRLLLPLNFHSVNIHIFTLVHQLRLLLALTFVPLPYLFG